MALPMAYVDDWFCQWLNLFVACVPCSLSLWSMCHTLTIIGQWLLVVWLYNHDPLGQWLPLSGYTITCMVIQSRSLCQWLPLSGYTITILIGPMASRCLVINLPSGIEYTHCHLARYVIPTTLVVCFLSFGTILCHPHNIIVVCFLYLFH